MNLLNLNYPDIIQNLSYYHERFMIYLLNRINDERYRDRKKSTISQQKQRNVGTKSIHIPETFKNNDLNRLIAEFGVGVIKDGDSNEHRDSANGQG